MLCKYIVLRDNFTPILFHSAIQHIDEANGRSVVTAGFVKIDFGSKDVCCFGGSTSLGGILSNPKVDQKLIFSMLTEGCTV